MRQGGWIAVLAAGMTLVGSSEMSYAAHRLAGFGTNSPAALYGVEMSGAYDHARQGYVGVETRDVTGDELGTLKLKESRGAEIVNLDHDGPACKAGMRMHDVILQMNGQVIESEDQLKRMLRETPAGRTVNFLVSRDGLTQTFTVQMADRRTVGLQAWEQHYTVPDPGPRPPAAEYGARGFGFLSASPAPPSTVAPAPKGHRDFLAMSMILSSSFTGAQLELIGPQLAEFFGATGGAGLLVRSVEGNSPAEAAGMRAGDVVVRINSTPVASGTDWTKTVHDNKGRPLPVVVIRDKQEQTLTLTPDGKKRSSLKMGLGLEEFFEQTEQQTRGLLAKL